MYVLNELLTKTNELFGSDVHITVGLPPMVRLHGQLTPLGEEALTPLDTENFAKEILGATKFKEYCEIGEYDIAYAIPGVARFRVNLYKDRGTHAIALRLITEGVPTLDGLRHPSILKDLTKKRRGLVLVTGPTGSGKSTTLAAMIDEINSNRSEHIITLEDPIEYLHQHKKSIVNQREVGNDTQSFNNALRAILREDPDVILIGEMRDFETIQIALTAAETGHLVFSTLHTIGADKTIDRVIDVFPPHQQQQIRVQLAGVLQGIISQQLMPTADNKSRVAALEVMTITPAIQNLIREGKSHQIISSIQTGAKYGMKTMDMALADLYKQRKITKETALQYAVDKEVLKRMMIM